MFSKIVHCLGHMITRHQPWRIPDHRIKPARLHNRAKALAFALPIEGAEVGKVGGGEER